MRRAMALLAALAVLAPSAGAFAKPRGCFTKAEETAEELVRHGLRLREGGLACDREPWNAGTAPLWEAIDKQYGARFKQQTDIRQAAFMREFANDAENKLRIWNARIVFYYRHYPLSDGYCTGIRMMLEEMLKKGWPIFVKQAHIARDEIRMTYEPCNK